MELDEVWIIIIIIMNRKKKNREKAPTPKKMAVRLQPSSDGLDGLEGVHGLDGPEGVDGLDGVEGGDGLDEGTGLLARRNTLFSGTISLLEYRKMGGHSS